MIKKIFRFKPEVVTCLNCLCNYPMPCTPEGQKYGEWCQVHSHHVVPEETSENEERAARCKQWIPREISRSTAAAEEDNPERWYEKDSMG